MKVIIEDHVLKLNKEPETELPINTVIRFEMGNTSLSVSITDEGLKIYKINNTIEGSVISIKPLSTNVVYIK